MQLTIKTSTGELAVLKHEDHPGQPTIVFLHDSLGCIELWRGFPKKLGELANCNVLVYDRLGYGKSGDFSTSTRGNDYLEKEADVLREVLEMNNIDNAILFGHSDGGSIALIAAAKYPSPIQGVITEGAHVFVEEITLQGIREAVNAYHTTNLKEKLQKYHGDKTDGVFDAWTKTWLSDEYRSWNIEHFLPQIKSPALIIQGEKDEYGTLEQVNRIVSQVGGLAGKMIIPGVGHTPHKEAADVVLEQSAAFINKMIKGE